MRHTGGWDVGMLDIGQDHLLCHLFENGIFGRGLIFKGGTALRKCRIGPGGRFSTDLDFAVLDSALIEEVFFIIEGHSCHGFTFGLNNEDPKTGKADLVVSPPFNESSRITSPHLRVASKLDISPRAPWMVAERLKFVNSPVHRVLNHNLPSIPIVCLEEAVAEKLARYVRDPILRDLYDLWWYGKNVWLDESVIRSLWVKKVYLDSILERRWKSRKFEPGHILTTGNLKVLSRESIGLYNDDADVATWDSEFRSRYAFLLQLSEEDLHWSRCDPRDQYAFERQVSN
jgi:hypothetical protein